jgi:hypothetical protein
MISRGFLLGFAMALLCRSVAIAQGQDDPAAIKRLAFLAGSWQCVIHGNGVPKGDVERISYEFAPDWSWMIERSNLVENGQAHWGAQLWGYDAQHRKLVAYQFSAAGVFTKAVNGWVRGGFESKRDYDGAMVTMRPIDQNTFE